MDSIIKPDFDSSPEAWSKYYKELEKNFGKEYAKRIFTLVFNHEGDPIIANDPLISEHLEMQLIGGAGATIGVIGILMLLPVAVVGFLVIKTILTVLGVIAKIEPDDLIKGADIIGQAKTFGATNLTKKIKL